MDYTETGTPALAAALKAMANRMTRSAALKAVRAGGDVICATMVEKTRVQVARNVGSDSLEEGELKENIRTRAKFVDGQATSLIGPVGKNGKIARAAHLVEFGHRMVTGGKSKLDAAGQLQGDGKVHDEDVQAYPFLRPAYEESHGAAIAEVAAVLAEELKKGAK